MVRHPLSSRRRVRFRRARYQQRGITLLEVLVSIGILALIGSLIYGAFDGMSKTRKNLSGLNERYHQGRRSLARMSREIQSAFISSHHPLSENQRVRETAFVGHDQSPIDRLDFNSFSHRRISRDSHESDQNELSYFGSRDPNSRAVDLARRESTTLDLDPASGGVVMVMAEDVDSLDITYLDPLTGEWQESWDSTSTSGQLDRLPAQVKIHLVLNGGMHGDRIQMATRTALPMRDSLNFFGLIPKPTQPGGTLR